MEVFAKIVTYLLVAASVAMIVIVLLQKSKSAGLGAAYGSETESFSNRGKSARRESKLQRITVIIAIVIGVLALALLVL